ncbi:hypothetical protein MMC21_007604 [Puttea exsequens]|nr:hypothetical protein [Puttea exsequens]
MQGLAPLSENQNFVRTLPGSAAWSLQTEVESVQSIPSAPPPTDIGGVPDPNGSLWPLFPTDTDWQFDFDDQLTTEPNTTFISAASIAVNELDLSQSYNHPTLGSESAGLSRNLIEYLSLSEKCHDGFASWYRNNETLMESCKAACFRKPVGISNFLTMPYLDSIVRETVSRPREGSTSISLIDSVMAFGYQAYLTVSQRFINSEERNRAQYYAKIPLRSRGSVLRSPNTLLKFQTILAMTTISEQIDEIIHCELIAGAVSCARALKLDYRDLMHGANTSNQDKDLAKRSLWYLYSIEAPQCLRHGISPVLNHDWIDHSPPQAGTEADWFSVQCFYAIVISSAAEMLYTQRALRQSLIEREQKLKTAFELLEGWRKHLPTPLQELHKQNTHLILDDCRVRDITLSIFRQYHEAIFMICFPWAGSQSDGRVSEDCRRKSVELCVNSAQVVLAIANQILNLDILDRYADMPFPIRD